MVTALPVRLAAHRGGKPRVRFGEPTYGNRVRFLIDGEQAFAAICDAIDRAQTSILIANYDMDPELKFVRKRRAVPRAVGGSSHDEYPLQRQLLRKAEHGVEVKIVVWEPRLALRIIPGADERGIDGRAEQVEKIVHVAKWKGLDHKVAVRIDSTAPTLTSAHHEKIVVIDNRIGFCGGLDLSKGKWDTSSHDFDNPQRDPGSEPWHDVQLMVQGPVVWDLVYHFQQRWLYSESRDVHQVRGLRLHLNYSSVGKEGTMHAEALRTWKGMNRNGGIKSWYATMFRQAAESIYIENQFPFQDSFATRLLAKNLEEKPELRVIIVGPLEPNLPGLVGSVIARMSVNDVRSNLAKLRKAGGDRVKTYSLVSQHPTEPENRRQIYVHSKVMIVDDKFVTVGSANTDKNGFRDSSELNVGISSELAARELRERLWQEHLGIISRRSVENFAYGFHLWEKSADDNGERVRNGKPLKSHVYYYNFSEIGLPPPYPEAAKADRFALI